MGALLAIVLGSCGIFVLGLYAWQCVSARSSGDAFSWLSASVMLVGFIAMFVFGIIWGSTYLDSYNQVQRLNAFQNETMSAYEYTINRTESVTIDLSQTRGYSVTDFSYQQQGAAVSDRIKEFRDKISEYNQALYSLRGKNRLSVFGAMYYDAPDDLKPIRLGTVPAPNP